MKNNIVFSTIIKIMDDDLMSVGDIIEISPTDKLFKCMKIDAIETLDIKQNQYTIKSNIYSDKCLFLRKLNNNFIVVFDKFNDFVYNSNDDYSIIINENVLKSKTKHEMFCEFSINNKCCLRKKYMNDNNIFEIYKNYDSNKIEYYLYGKVLSINQLLVF